MEAVEKPSSQRSGQMCSECVLNAGRTRDRNCGVGRSTTIHGLSFAGGARSILEIGRADKGHPWKGWEAGEERVEEVFCDLMHPKRSLLK